MTRRWACTWLGWLALVALCSACGIGAESQPNRLDRARVPFGLLAPATTTTTTEAQGVGITIFFEIGQRLAGVSRTVAAPATVPEALNALERGPTAAESDDGLTSPLSSSAPLRLDSLQAGMASIDAPIAFESLAGQDQIVAAAQLVFTLTGLPGVTGVVLLIEGQPAQVPTAGGSLSEGPLTRADYASLGPQ